MFNDCRHIFNDEGLSIAGCCIHINGNKKNGYHSTLFVVRDNDFHSMVADATIEEVLARKYPDIKGLREFLQNNPTISPFSLTFLNACAKAALALPPIFNESEMIFLKLYPNDKKHLEHDRLADAALIQNAVVSYHDEEMIFAQDVPVLHPGQTRYLSFDHKTF